jgi:hypothetical protein
MRRIMIDNDIDRLIHESEQFATCIVCFDFHSDSTKKFEGWQFDLEGATCPTCLVRMDE